MNLNTKGKGEFIADGCDDTSVAAIFNAYAQVSQTEQKFPLVGFDDELSNK